MLAFSSDKIEGVMGTLKTITAKWFEYFIVNLFKSNNNNVLIILDKAKIHTAKLINELCRKNQVIMLTVPSYSPFLNSCEKLILKIKIAIRTMQRKARIISLRSFRNVIDKLGATTMKISIAESWQETFNYIKSYICHK